MDKGSFRTVLVFTLVYGVLALALLAGQPSLGRMQTAYAAAGDLLGPDWVMLASAE